MTTTMQKQRGPKPAFPNARMVQCNQKLPSSIVRTLGTFAKNNNKQKNEIIAEALLAYFQANGVRTAGRPRKGD